jgi:hypothetical protein
MTVRSYLARQALGLIFGLCVLAWLAPADQARHLQAARPASSPLLGGVNVSAVERNSLLGEVDPEIAVAHQLHAKLVRMEVPWSVVEPSGPHQIEPRALAYVDRVVADAASDGIQIILMVQSTPCWASSAPTSLLSRCQPGRDSQANSWPPTQPADFAAFCAYLAQRYGPHLAAIEIWNEPDQVNEAYFAGANKATRYAALLHAAYPAIKHASADVAVLAGSLVGSNGAFLRALYAAGIKGYYDGLAVHFYHLTLASVRSIHEVQLANGDSAPLWLDEFGWSSCWPRLKIEQEQACVTTQTQARNIANTFRALSAASYVSAAVLYELRDSSTESFGLVSTTGARKPAFAAFAGVLASPFGSVSRITLSLRRRGARILASGSGPVGDFMQLEAFRAGVLRYRAVFTLDRFNRFSIALPSVLGTRGVRVRVFEFWTGQHESVEKSVR